MTDVSFNPTFQHTDWVDNVDRVQAGGPNGFNARLNALESDLQQLSTVVGQIDSAIDQLGQGAPPQQRRLVVPLALTSFIGGGGNGWTFDSVGVAHPAGGSGGGLALQSLNLPDQTRLLTFRAIGLYPGSPARLSVGLYRVPLVSPGEPVKLAEVRHDTPGITNPYDITLPVEPSLARVNNGTFRYLLIASAQFISDSNTISLAAVHLTHINDD